MGNPPKKEDRKPTKTKNFPKKQDTGNPPKMGNPPKNYN